MAERNLRSRPRLREMLSTSSRLMRRWQKTPPPTQTTMLTLLIRMTHQSILRRSLKLPRTPHSGPRLMR